MSSRWLIVLLLIMLLVLSGCAFTPRVSLDQEYANQCSLYTKQMELSVHELRASGCNGSHKGAEACLLAYAIGVPVMTFTVSGSIVLVGNTLHWLEYQGRCDDSAFSTGIEALKRSVLLE